MQGQEWCTIESDPGVFTELIKRIGVEDIQVEEIYDLNDDNLIEQHQPIYGFIFLFRWTSKGEKRECLEIYDQDLFFANQVIQNACATQAIVSVLLNTPGLRIGQELQNYKEFSMALDPKDRGLALGNSEPIRTAHNSFAHPEPFYFSGKKKAKEGDAIYHFVAYVPFKEFVYELDGLQKGPIILGETGANWVQVAREAVLKRIAIYQESEITFTLLTINKCKKAIANEKINQCQRQQFLALQRLQFLGCDLTQDQKQLYEILQNNNYIIEEQEQDVEITGETLLKELYDLQIQIHDYEALIQNENTKLEQQKIENTRRKHNYIPLIIELLKMTAKKGKLEDLIEESRKKQANKPKKQSKK